MLSQPEQAYTKSLWAVRSLQKAEEAGPDLLLRVNAVDASYGGKVKVLENVTVFVPRGRTVAVVGESGSGKSTLARVITGLLPPQTGDIVFDGQTLPPSFKSRPKELLRRMQMIYQMPDTAEPPPPVHDIIGGAGITSVSRAGRDKRVSNSWTWWNSTSADDRLPSEVSGGQTTHLHRPLGSRSGLIICGDHLRPRSDRRRD
jgi:peptide/nickel transport system ATP-binding protein